MSVTSPSIGIAALNNNKTKELSLLNQVSQLPSPPTVRVNMPSMNRVALNHSEANLFKAYLIASKHNDRAVQSLPCYGRNK
eukprot:11765566-Ditylum_brightwellii.AAC.1